MKRWQDSGYGLGSEIVFTLISKDEDQAKAVFKQLWLKTKAFDNRFSRFKETSELSQLNLSGHLTKASPELIKLTREAKQLSQQTDGLFNPLTLPALQRAGYKGSWPNPSVFKPSLEYSDRTQVGKVSGIVIKGKSVTIPANTALDFGGIGKGYLLEELADYLEGQGIKDYWLSLGGDILVSGFNLENQPWQVAIAKADQPEEVIKYVSNPHGQRLAIASSGTTKRRGQSWHHIINPSTGKPAETDVAVATLVAQDATLADVYATCLVIVGSAGAKELLKNINFSLALLQTYTDKAIKLIEIKGPDGST